MASIATRVVIILVTLVLLALEVRAFVGPRQAFQPAVSKNDCFLTCIVFRLLSCYSLNGWIRRQVKFR